MLGARPVFLYRGPRAVGVDMTSAATITQFTGGVMTIGIFMLLVRSRLVVAGVTACTVWLKRWVLPGNEFCIGLVTRGAQQVSSVILRLVGQGHVAVVSGRPRIRDVAGITFLCGAEVTRVLTDRCYAIVAG